VLCYDIQDVGDSNAKQVSFEVFQQEVEVLSLHIPWTPETDKMVDTDFINGFAKPFWIINTSRGKNIVTADLVTALISGKVLGRFGCFRIREIVFETLFRKKYTRAFHIY
jgi:phosphoglycerate dehydrogenase-like enzyme